MGVRMMNYKDYINELLTIELFSVLSQDELLRIVDFSCSRIKKYTKGQIVYLSQELCKSMDIILEGSVSIQKIDEEGNVLKIAGFTVKDVIGVNLMFSSRNRYPMTVIAETKVVILHLDEVLIIQLSQSNAKFMAVLLKTISDKTLVLTDKIDAISLKTIRMRINDFLQYEYHVQKSKVIMLNSSKKELAERLGIQRTSLSRELDKMRKDGLIDFDSKTITILQ